MIWYCGDVFVDGEIVCGDDFGFVFNWRVL